MRVFLSYAREDLAFGERLVAALRARHVDVLWDRTLSPSLDYSEQIREMIRACDTFAVLLTPHSVASAECAAEMSYAIDLGKRLLPILGEAEVDPIGLPNAIRRAQWCLCAGSDGLAGAVLQIEEALQTNIELVAMHTRLLNRVAEWEARNRDPGTLLRGRFLDEAEDWLMRAAGTAQRPQATALQRTYVASSRAEETRRRVARRREVVLGIALLAAALLVTAYLYVDAERNRRAADDSRNAAEENRKSAEQNRRIAEQNADKARASLEERGRQELIEGRWEGAAVLLAEALRLGADTRAIRLMLGRALVPLNGLRATIIGAENPVICAGISADGKRVIAASLGGEATVWDVGTGLLVAVLSDHPGAIGEVHLSADGTRALVVFTLTRTDVAETGFYKTSSMPAYLWDVDRPALIRELDLGDYERLRGAAPPLIATLPGGQRFVLPNRREFRFSDGEPVAAEPAVPNTATRAGVAKPMRPGILAWSTDRSIIVIPGPANGALVTSQGALERPLLASLPMENARIAFRSESRDLVIVNASGRFHRIVEKDNGVENRGPLPQGSEIALSPDGRSAVVFGKGTGVPINLDTGRREDEWKTEGARFSLDGLFVLGWSKTASQLFEFWAPRLPDFQVGMGRRAMANYDQGIAAVSNSGSVVFADSRATQVWWRSRPGVKHTGTDSAEGTPGDPALAEFSRNGDILAVALSDGSILIREAGSPEGWDRRLRAGAGFLTHLDFSHDSKWLAAASTNGTATVWEPASGNLVSTCSGHRGAIVAVHFSRDNTLLATAGTDGTARVWELPSCRELLRFPGHAGGAKTAIFDAGATRLATADRQTVRIWELIRETRSSTAVANVANAFSPACLVDGGLGQWTMPSRGERRGVCSAK